MQSKISYFNKTIFKKNITHFWPIWTVYLLLLFLIEPFNLFLQTGGDLLARQGAAEYIQDMKMERFKDILRITSHPVLLFLIALVSAMAVFFYMYQAKNSNMMHSLPVNRTELFLTNYISGLSFVILPQIFNFLITVFVCLGRGITDLGHLMWCLLVMMGISFFAYSLAVCVGMLTGQFVTMPIFFVIANGLVMSLEVLVRMLISSFTYGMYMNVSPTFSKKFTPIYYILRNLRINYLSDGEHTQLAVSGGKMVACYAAVGLVLALIAYFLYQNKKLESVGDFIAIKVLKPVFRWGAAICFAVLGAISGSVIAQETSESSGLAAAIFCMFVIGIVVFFVAEMLLQKKFKVFTKRKFAECGAMLALSLIVVVGVKADFFGQESYVPKTADIESVEMVNGIKVYAQEEEDIEQIRQIHAMILENKKDITENLKTNNDRVNYVNFVYKLKNGKTVNRSYDIPGTIEYYEKEGSVLRSIIDIQNEYENYMAGLFGKDFENKKPITVRVTVYNVIEQVEDEIALDSTLVQELYDAVAADIKEGNLKIETYEESLNTEIYYNEMIFSMYAEKSALESKENDAWEEQQSNEVWVSFTKDCTHILEVLNKANVFNEENRLLTYEEINEIEETTNIQ